MNLSGPGHFLVGRLLIAPSTSALVIGLFRVSTLPGLGLRGCKNPGIYPFLRGLLLYVYRVVCSNL